MEAPKQNPSVGILIRFSDSEETLPAVLAAISSQTHQPDQILGVANHSTDNSLRLLADAGARVIEWDAPYHHASVLNYGFGHLKTDLVLVLSSHTVLQSETVIEDLVECFSDERVACASAKWDNDPFYSNRVSWDELKTKGLRFGSIYSNSMGMIRRSCWVETSFDESIVTSEDYAWAIERLKRGEICCRTSFPFKHLREGKPRHHEFAKIVFRLARRHQLRVTWLGPRESIRQLLQGWLERKPSHEWKPITDRLFAWIDSFTLRSA